MAFAFKAGLLLRAIWNGPFFIGKLAQPVSIGDALLKFSETIWRVIIIILALIASASAVLVAWIYVVDPALFPPAKNSVQIFAEFDDGTIPPKITIEPPYARPAPQTSTTSIPLPPHRSTFQV